LKKQHVISITLFIIMLSIKEYTEKTTIDNGIEEIIIEKLKYPLNNLPITVNKITIEKQINVFRRKHKIPYGCELIIENNKIDNIETFNKMQKDDYLDITDIELNNCNLKPFPIIIFKLTNLQKLYLYESQITEIPDSIASLTNLQKLDLSYNQITEIPDSIGFLTNLQILWLYNNKITEIPDSIAFLTNLQELYLVNNKITEIPDSIASLTNLQKLSLSRNQITKIPDSIVSLTNLQELYLYNNEITEIPEWLTNMKIQYLQY